MDYTGRPLRSDVRMAARDVWRQACSETRAFIGDDADAAELLDSSVAQISRYLDRHRASPFSQNAAGLLVVAFRRTLRRHVTKLRRFEDVTGSGRLDDFLVAPDWVGFMDLQLDAEKIIRLLSHRSRTVVALKAAGYEWRHIASLAGTSISRTKSAFWREVRRVRQRVKDGRSIRASEP